MCTWRGAIADSGRHYGPDLGHRTGSVPAGCLQFCQPSQDGRAHRSLLPFWELSCLGRREREERGGLGRRKEEKGVGVGGVESIGGWQPELEQPLCLEVDRKVTKADFTKRWPLS